MQTIHLDDKAQTPTAEIYTVSRVNSEVRHLLENNFPLLWVEGEISNFAAPSSGHWYFSLKDPTAQIRCALFRARSRNFGFTPKEGMHVLVKARLSLYENRGDFQLLVEEIEEQGEGKLRRAFEALKKKLQAAGLFDLARKKPLPTFPQHIGIVTSPTGAAIRDILTVLKRRFPCVPITIYPTLVQGDAAANQIAAAIETANRRAECDVLIVTRGGGSLEDLWPFNEEVVALAIYQSAIPTISAVGHEVDFTIADFVADLRAPTPSAAAEIIAPDQHKLAELFLQQWQRLMHQMRQKYLHTREQITWMQKHLFQQHPKRQLVEKMQRLDHDESTLKQWQQRCLVQIQNQIKNLHLTLLGQTPTKRIDTLEQQTILFQQQLQSAWAKQLHLNQTALSQAAAKFDALSPLATLSRGYAIATHGENHELLRDAEKIAPGDNILLQLQNGKINCKVEEVLADKSE